MLSTDPCCMQGLRSRLTPTQFRGVHGTENEPAFWDATRKWRGVLRPHGYGAQVEYTEGPFLS